MTSIRLHTLSSWPSAPHLVAIWPSAPHTLSLWPSAPHSQHLPGDTAAHIGSTVPPTWTTARGANLPALWLYSHLQPCTLVAPIALESTHGRAIDTSPAHCCDAPSAPAARGRPQPAFNLVPQPRCTLADPARHCTSTLLVGSPLMMVQTKPLAPCLWR